MEKQKRIATCKVYLQGEENFIEYVKDLPAKDDIKDVVANIYDIGLYVGDDKELRFWPPEAIKHIIARLEIVPQT